MKNLNKFLAFTIILFIISTNTSFTQTATEKSLNTSSNYLVLRDGLGWAANSTRSPGGTGSSEMQFKSEFDLNFAYGHHFFNWVRLELELGYVYMKLDGQVLNLTGEEKDMSGYDRHWRGVFNAYANLENLTAFTPFAGAGIGVAQARLNIKFTRKNGEIAETDDCDYPLVYQFIAGVSWNFHPSWELELMYRYYATNERTHDNHDKANYPKVTVDGTKSSFVQLGIRFWLGKK